MFREPLIKSRMTAHSVLRDGMQGVRGSEWSIPFATSATRQAARKTSAREGCGKIARSRRCAPRHRSPGYDLRRTPGDHRDFASNAVHGGLNQRFPRHLHTPADSISLSPCGMCTRFCNCVATPPIEPAPMVSTTSPARTLCKIICGNSAICSTNTASV